MSRYGMNIRYVAGSPWSDLCYEYIEKYSGGTALLATNEGKNLGNCNFFSLQHAGEADN